MTPCEYCIFYDECNLEYTPNPRCDRLIEQGKAVEILSKIKQTEEQTK